MCSPWLLADLRDRPNQRDQALALEAILTVWRSRGQSAELLQEISEAVKGMPDLEEKLEGWLLPAKAPPKFKPNPQQQAQRDAADQLRAEAERSWSTLADNIAIERAQSATAPSLISEYLATAFFIDGDAATNTLVNVSASLSATLARALASALIPKLFGNSWTPPAERMNNLSVSNLERLILFAFARLLDLC
jgi:hypothetical protein